MAIFGPIFLWVTPLEIVNFLIFYTCCFYSLERGFFAQEYRKRQFPGLYYLKKKSWRNGRFWTKTMG